MTENMLHSIRKTGFIMLPILAVSAFFEV